MEHSQLPTPLPRWGAPPHTPPPRRLDPSALKVGVPRVLILGNDPCVKHCSFLLSSRAGQLMKTALQSVILCLEYGRSA